MQANLQHELSDLFEAYVRLASDSVSALRFCDVSRVLEQAADVQELYQLSEYLIDKRSDFDVAEIIDIEAEIIQERDWRFVRKRR